MASILDAWADISAKVPVIRRALAVMLALGLSLAFGQTARAESAEDALADRLSTGSAHALVIGVARFDAAGWPDLGGVDPEVAQVSAALQAQGFTTHYPVVDPDDRLTKRALRDAVSRFARDFGADPDNRLVIYFATHGTKETGGKGLMIASDSLGVEDEGFAGSAYSVDELSHDLASVRARHLFIFVNACFSGSMVPALGSGDPTRSAGPLEGEEAEEVTPATWALRLLDQRAWLVLTAGSDDQEVPDRGNPFVAAVTGGLAGKADLDGDGLILGAELAQHVRSSVALATLADGEPNDPVFAVLSEGEGAPASLIGDFVFRSPLGAEDHVDRSETAILAARNSRLPDGQFTDCADCPVMVTLPDPEGALVAPRLALGRTEVTYAEWDACYREFSCRYLRDDGQGRGNRAAGGVTWADALDFVEWMNTRRGRRCERYRLPALDEWQAAAGKPEAPQAICRDCDDQGGLAARGAAAAGSVAPNALGLQDMAGNLWEWVRGPEAACTHADLAAGQGRCEADGIVVGGAFSTRSDALERAMAGASYPRVDHRTPDGHPIEGLPTLGLRLACDLTGEG